MGQRHGGREQFGFMIDRRLHHALKIVAVIEGVTPSKLVEPEIEKIVERACKKNADLDLYVKSIMSGN